MPKKSDKAFFTKVKVARELLKERAEDILKQYLDLAATAKDSGDYETAAKILQWLIEHMPKDDDVGRVVEPSIDKQQVALEGGPKGPMIQIGIAVGGVSAKATKALPKPADVTVDAEVLKHE